MRCSPVKYGWQFEHSSVRSTGRVDLVVQVLPHAHVTVASTYCGCMFGFIFLSYLSDYATGMTLTFFCVRENGENFTTPSVTA